METRNLKFMLKKILIGALGLIAVAGFGLSASASSLPVGGQTYYLAGAGVTATQNTIQLTSLKTPDGTLLTMANFGTVGYGALDPQTTAKLEDVSFTGITQNANGTATLTGVTRGVDFIYPYASTLSLEKSHSGGAAFIVTNTAQFYYNEFAMPTNANVTTWPFASTSPATKGYVDAIAFGGVLPQASTIAQGVVQLATGVQIASSTANGSAGPLAIPASLATSTYNAATAPLRVVVTQNNGTIDPNFLPQNFASTTKIGYDYAFNIGQHIFIATSTGTSTWAVPSGIRTVHLRLVGPGGGGAGGCSGSCGSGGAGSGGYVDGMIDVSATTSITYYVAPGGTQAAQNTSNAGTTGNTTTFSTFASATGGTGGVTQTNANGIAGAGGGGVGIAGVVGLFTSNGQGGTQGFNSSTGSLYMTGQGGTTPLGMSCGGGATTASSGSPGCIILTW